MIINKPEIDNRSVCAWLYEKFHEPKLLSRYEEHGGKFSALNNVLSAEGRENVPRIAVLAAAVPYLDCYEKPGPYGTVCNKNVKILNDSDKAVAHTDYYSLMNFINFNTNI